MDSVIPSPQCELSPLLVAALIVIVKEWGSGSKQGLLNSPRIINEKGMTRQNDPTLHKFQEEDPQRYTRVLGGLSFQGWEKKPSCKIITARGYPEDNITSDARDGSIY